MKRDIKLQLISNKIAKAVAENVEDLKIEFDAENAAAQEAVAMIVVFVLLATKRADAVKK